MSVYKKNYPHTLTDAEILELLVDGTYQVDANTGKVTGPYGREITPFLDEDGYHFVRLYSRKRRKAVIVGKLVWMAVTRQVVPPGFEIHHSDEDPRNNAWLNLICWHRLDHRKHHSGVNGDDEIPF